VRVALPVLLLACAACATGSPPDAQLAAARAMIIQTEPLGWRYAPAELRLAQAKLSAAEQAMAREDWALARALAEQAEVDAKYAWAIADAERSRSELGNTRR
jgi:hypothetical protein